MRVPSIGKSMQMSSTGLNLPRSSVGSSFNFDCWHGNGLAFINSQQDVREGEGKMYRTEHFIASAERDVKIIQSMRRALFAMELVNLSIVEVDGARWRLNFSFEIQQLAETLRLIGVGDDE